MKRAITGLSLLLLLLCGAKAQSISQYEYWTDDDYASRKVSSATGGDVSLSVSTEMLEAGVHFLNFRACRDDGVWGNFYRYLYYIPTLKSVVSGDVRLEYWLDDHLAGAKSEAVNGGNLSLTIDVSALTPGVHYFNCTPMTTAGERGSSERYLFYVPQTFDLAATSPIKGFEYWIDDNYASKKVDQSGSQNPVFTIGIGNLESGVHYFNCRVFNERGEYGNPVREMFYIPSTQTFADAKLASYEYWFDDEYAHCVKGSSANTEQAFTIDVSQLSSGVHYFNYWPIDNRGRRGNVTRQLFYLAKMVDPSTSEEIDYEYWIDSDTEHKVTGKGTTGDYVFNIDISALDKGAHTFNFRAKNMLDQWGDTFIENFTISSEQQQVVTITADDLTMVYGDEVPELTYKVSGGELSGQPKLTTIATKNSPVGTYSITIEKGTVTNEHFNLVPGKLTITKAPLTVTAKSYTRVEGEENPAFEVTYSGWKNDETVAALTKQPTASTIADVNSEPGTYPITVTGGEAQNYEFSYVNGTLTITASEMITITADNVLMVYGDDVPKLTYTVTGGDLVGQPNLSTTATKTSTVGTYPISIKIGSVTNKRITLVDGVLTIDKAPLTATAQSYTRLQGEDNPVFEILYEGWKNNENETVLKVKPIATTIADSYSEPGEYPIVVSGGEAQNYEFSYVDGVLTVMETTSIDELLASGRPFDVYTTTGIKVRSQVTTLKNLSRGIYIVEGKKIIIK